MNKFEEKKKARLERFEQYAENAKTRSTQLFERADKMSSIIPMGQPILVGHHSEKADRNYRKRIHNNMDKACEEHRKAEHWEKRIESAENNRQIQSDDPEALTKLANKAESLKKTKDEMKRINKEYRKHKDLAKIEMNDDWRDRASRNLSTWTYSRAPFPSFMITNIGAKIKTAEQREQALMRAEFFENFEVNQIKVELLDGQIKVTFPYKPNEDTRKKLKTWPVSLKWSGFEKAWVRKYTGQGTYYSEQLKSVLNLSKGEN